MAAVGAGATINTDGQKGVVRTFSAQTEGQANVNLGLGINFAQSTGYVKGPAGNLDTVLPVDPTDTAKRSGSDRDAAQMISSNLFLSLGLLHFWDMSIALPIYYDRSGFGPSDGGTGDLEISSKFLLPPFVKDSWLYQSLLISVTVPTGMKKNGLFPRHLYFLNRQTNPVDDLYSSDYVTVKPLMLFTAQLSRKIPLLLHLNLGGVLTEVNKQNTIIGSMAVEYSPKDFVTLFVDFSGESRWSNLSSTHSIRKDPLYCTPGIKINTLSGLYFFFAGDFSLSSKSDNNRRTWTKKGFEYSTAIIPDYGVQFAVGWTGAVTTQDRDKDGIRDDLDKCPDEPEDADGFEDADGCPDPDNDKDGVCDPWVSEQHREKQYAAVCKGIDKCPNAPEDFDGFQDEDGCPDADNDGDGIPDVMDRCPNAAEDFDGFQDNDGCPDYDNDRDGIPDTLDKCPNIPEDVDGFEDADGCPDYDNDRDGVPDTVDKCINVPEDKDGYQDEDGCPEGGAPVQKAKGPQLPNQQVLRGVTFRNNTAELIFESNQYLDPIVKALKENTDIEIEVRGHTDSMGKYTKNMQLSQMRAEAVRQYIISQGIDSQRVRAAGFGPNSPVADNRTAAGRAQNRRIEIVRLK
jgi:outer membrane protein OmpA-like peptidoglycan-associated protein